jgi:hypothetical protein
MKKRRRINMDGVWINPEGRCYQPCDRDDDIQKTQRILGITDQDSVWVIYYDIGCLVFSEMPDPSTKVRIRYTNGDRFFNGKLGTLLKQCSDHSSPESWLSLVDWVAKDPFWQFG